MIVVLMGVCGSGKTTVGEALAAALGWPFHDADLDDVASVVADSGEGRWTVQESVEQGVPAPVLALSLMARFASQGRDDYAGKVLAMMRKSFGGHAIETSAPEPGAAR